MEQPSQDAAAAIRRLSEGLPAGSGSASLGFASRLLKEVGGNLTLLPMPEEGPTGVSKGNCVRAWIPGIKQS